MTIGFSRVLAIFLGIVTPLFETIRRWSTWHENPLSYFDDFILGGCLLYGAWRVARNAGDGQRYLAAAWGVALGMVLLSFFGQIESLRKGIADPAPVSSEIVLLVKGIGLVLIIAGLIGSVRRLPTADNLVSH